MTKEQMTDIVQQQLDAYNARDIDAFCECFHPEVIVTSMVSGLQTISGMEQFREKYRIQFDANPKLQCELKHRIVLDSTVLDEELVTGLAAFPHGVHAVAIYAFRDGLIDRVWFPKG